ncbi:MAG: metallophosphoesterase [Nitriliruptoraceae bacterium]
MRILLASDLHYALPQLDWIAARADGFDVVALAGDHLDIASPVDLGTQIVALRTSLAALATRTQLLVASGNHDLNTRNPAGEKTSDWLAPLRAAGAAVDGDTIEVAGAYWTVLEWWDGPHARAEVEAQLAAVAATVGERPWLWVYHSPPHGPLAWTGTRHYGDPVVADWIARWRPTAVLTGHIHQAPFTSQGSWLERLGDTWLFNAGKQPGPTPSHVEIDLAGGTARWVSYQGVAERELTGTTSPSAQHRTGLLGEHAARSSQ